MLNPDKITLIAEISGNHYGDIEVAKALIESAHDCKADLVKLQAYTPDTITIDSDEYTTVWQGKRTKLYDLYQKAHTPFEWFPELFKFAEKKGVKLFASVFDDTSVDMLEELNCPIYKISSFELNDIPLLQKVAATGKHTILSTGMANAQELVIAAKQFDPNKLTILHCNSAYPANPASAYLKNISFIQERLSPHTVGLSDHTRTNVTAIAAVALGARVIEKHFTFNSMGDGPDDHFSLEPADFVKLRHDVNTALEAVGKRPRFGVKENEKNSANMRRSLFFVANIREGEKIKPEHIKSFRPCVGVEPVYYQDIIGKTASQNIKANTPVQWELIK